MTSDEALLALLRRLDGLCYRFVTPTPATHARVLRRLGRQKAESLRAAVGKLAPGGRLILYTGAAIVDGVDHLHRALRRAMNEAGCELIYSELDPDVFGEELDRPAYRDVERIAVVAAIATKP